MLSPIIQFKLPTHSPQLMEKILVIISIRDPSIHPSIKPPHGATFIYNVLFSITKIIVLKLCIKISVSSSPSSITKSFLAAVFLPVYLTRGDLPSTHLNYWSGHLLYSSFHNFHNFHNTHLNYFLGHLLYSNFHNFHNFHNTHINYILGHLLYSNFHLT